MKQIDDCSLCKKMKEKIIFKIFYPPNVIRQCQPGTPSAKLACPTAKQSASGMGHALDSGLVIIQFSEQ